DRFVGMLGGGHQYLNWKPNQKSSDYFDPISDDDGTLPAAHQTYLTDLLSSHAVQFVQRADERPFFLMLAYNAPHTPLQATQNYLDRFPGLKGKRKTYAAMISAMDDGIGRVLNALTQTGQSSETLVVFFSDNGGPTGANASNNAPLRGGKSTVLEGGVRVPFVVRYPAKLPSGTRYEYPVSTLDLLPTALAAAGVDVKGQPAVEGVDLTPFLSGQSTGRPHQTLHWRHRNGFHAVRHLDWKWIRSPGGAEQLYDLRSDVGESNDMSASHADVASQIRKRYEQWNRHNAARIPWHRQNPYSIDYR
ncbi:MAG: sulfatase-like hydrolase/transferase, partial [Planctomycetota bacterium]